MDNCKWVKVRLFVNLCQCVAALLQRDGPCAEVVELVVAVFPEVEEGVLGIELTLRTAVGPRIAGDC